MIEYGHIVKSSASQLCIHISGKGCIPMTVWPTRLLKMRSSSYYRGHSLTISVEGHITIMIEMLAFEVIESALQNQANKMKMLCINRYLMRTTDTCNFWYTNKPKSYVACRPGSVVAQNSFSIPLCGE